MAQQKSKRKKKKKESNSAEPPAWMFPMVVDCLPVLPQASRDMIYLNDWK